MTTATITPDLARTDHLLVADLIDPLPHHGSTPPGLRLTSQFVTELQIIGSRSARLAMLEAYERCAGDQWKLAVAVRGADHELVRPARTTRGLLELESTIRSLVGSLVDPVDSGSWIEIRATTPHGRHGSGVARPHRRLSKPTQPKEHSCNS